MMGRASADPFAAVEDLNMLGCFSGPAEPEKHLKQTVRCEKNEGHHCYLIMTANGARKSHHRRVKVTLSFPEGNERMMKSGGRRYRGKTAEFSQGYDTNCIYKYIYIFFYFILFFCWVRRQWSWRPPRAAENLSCMPRLPSIGQPAELHLSVPC